MFTGFNLKIDKDDESFFNSYFDDGQKLLASQKEAIQTSLESYICNNDILDGTKIQENCPCERAFRPNWRETAAQSSSLCRTLQAFLSKAAPVLCVRKGGYDYKHTAAPCKVPALP